MAIVGSPNYRVGLIIANSQPFHNGLIKIIGDALMVCDDIIISFTNYDTQFFDYNHNQQMGRIVYGDNKNISYFGIKQKPLVVIPKQILEETLTQLDLANYNKPTHFFTNLPDWETPAMELQLETQLISPLVDNHTDEIKASVEAGTDFWESKVPYVALEEIKSYIATKNRDF